MRGFLAITLAALGAVAGLTAQEAGTGTADIGAGRRPTLDLSLRVRCSTDPPLTILFPFDEMLTMVDAIAYVRIADVESVRDVISEEFGCQRVRPYIAQPLRLLDAAYPQGGAAFGFFGRGWESPLTRGDEAIVFLWRDRTGSYHEYGSRYRLTVRNGHVHPRPDDGSGFADGEAVGVVLNSLRDGMRAEQPGR